MMLSDLGHQVDVVSNGRQAVEAVQHCAYDAILMDLLMPELDGLQASQRIRSLTGDGVTPWIVAVTADEDSGRADECLAAGMNAFLSRPVRFEQLEAALPRVAGVRGQAAAACSPDRVVDSARDNHEKLRNLWDAYLADALVAMEKMDVLAAAGDFEGLRRQAHYLKGSSMVVGALGAANLCHQIDMRAATPEPLGTTLLDLRYAVEEAAFAGLRLPGEGEAP